VFVFGHLGFGRTIARPWHRALPVVPFVAGALLPDAIDKSLYYAHFSSFISCTRTFGHTGLFLGALALTAWLARSRTCAAIAAGVATHVLLDTSMDLLSPFPSSALMAFTWPFRQTYFATYDFQSPLDQLSQIWKPQIIVTEVIGCALLLLEYWRRRKT